MTREQAYQITVEYSFLVNTKVISKRNNKEYIVNSVETSANFNLENDFIVLVSISEDKDIKSVDCIVDEIEVFKENYSYSV